MSAAGRLRDEFVRISDMIAAARRLLADGVHVDLSPLAVRVHALCGAVAALPAEEGRGLKGEMLALSVRFDRLGETIRERIDAIAVEPRGDAD